MVFHSGEAVFRGKERNDIDTCLHHQIDIAFAVMVNAGLIRDEANLFTPQLAETIGFHDVESRTNIAVPDCGGHNCGNSAP